MLILVSCFSDFCQTDGIGNILFSSLKLVLKIWALAVGKKTEMLATGGGDAVINLWHDSTALDKEEAFRKEVSDITFSLDMIFIKQQWWVLRDVK